MIQCKGCSVEMVYVCSHEFGAKYPPCAELNNLKSLSTDLLESTRNQINEILERRSQECIEETIAPKYKLELVKNKEPEQTMLSDFVEGVDQ